MALLLREMGSIDRPTTAPQNRIDCAAISERLVP